MQPQFKLDFNDTHCKSLLQMLSVQSITLHQHAIFAIVEGHFDEGNEVIFVLIYMCDDVSDLYTL